MKEYPEVAVVLGSCSCCPEFNCGVGCFDNFPDYNPMPVLYLITGYPVDLGCIGLGNNGI
jgi:hypothetical protein